MFDALIQYFTIFSSLLIVIAFIRSNNILSIMLLNSAFSLFTVIMYLILDAPDVAMTEAAVSTLSSIFAIYTIKNLYSKNFVFIDSFDPWLFSGCLGFASLLIYSSLDLPEFGKPNFNPYYLENSLQDIGINSVVAAILASYRGYDTLLETLVILVGGISVLLVSDTAKLPISKSDQLITKMTRFMLPLILIFAFYLQLHGEISPGGGFQAGTIIAISFILYAMAFGENKLLELISITRLKIIAVLGVAIYFFTGLIGLISNKSFLDYGSHQQTGIMLVEMGVGLAVAATMLIIYLSLVYAPHKSQL
jgi:multicomponent Na+:H+ antiporter subunit B